jgi:hypothetical protein
MVIDSQDHMYQRRIVFRIPRDLSKPIMFLVSHTYMRRHKHQHLLPSTLCLLPSVLCPLPSSSPSSSSSPPCPLSG